MTTTHTDYAYIQLIEKILQYGWTVTPRNADRIRLHSPDKIRFNMTPLIHLRITAWKYALREMEWFLSGSSNVFDLHPSVRHWWHPWTDRMGNVLYGYSKQLRHFDGSAFRKGFDQVEAFIDGIIAKPYSARHLITTWHPEEMYSPKCPITNCHGTNIQAFVHDGILDLSMYQRSADVVLGLPHNWIQYWAFLLWLCHRTNTRPGTFIWDGGDVHIYKKQDHLDMAEKMKTAWCRATTRGPGPQLVYKPTSEHFKADDFTLSAPYTPIIREKVEMVV